MAQFRIYRKGLSAATQPFVTREKAARPRGLSSKRYLSALMASGEPQVGRNRMDLALDPLDGFSRFVLIFFGMRLLGVADAP